uniref:Sushi domain-containing protein n=1 Tax=Strigamia maritima TaxID=126957 RepID=T1J421_STRMM
MKATHGQVIQVTCDEQYEISYNVSWVKCVNGTWSVLPICLPARCKTLPPRPRHGMVIAPKTEHGMRAMYKCRDGFVLRGNNITECMFGQWTGHTPYCQEIYCPFPGAIDFGKILLVGNMGLYDYRPYVRKVTNNRQIMFECDKGYKLVDGPPGATCIGGRWSPKQLPRCIIGRHPRLLWHKRRRKRSSDNLAAVKNHSRRNPAASSCSPIPDAPYIHVKILQYGDDNTSFVVEGNLPQRTEVKVHCARGYGLNIGNRTAKCVRGKWRPRVPECITLGCKVPKVQNGVYHHQDLTAPENSEITHGEVATFSCLVGYQIQGPDTMRCWFGEWAIENFPECSSAPCELPHITHGQYGGGYRAGLTISHGSMVDYECENEYVKSTLRAIRCHLGDLKPRLPACHHQSMHIIPVLDGLPEGTDIQFKQHGSDISIIDFPASSFKRSCGPPARVQNALVYRDGRLITDNEHQFLDGTEVLFNCIASITGEKSTWKITCEDGNWVGRPHRCGALVGEQNFTTAIQILKFVHFCSSFVEGDPGSDYYEYLRNRSCVFRNTEPHLVTFYGDMRITDETMEFPPGTELVSRCRDVGKYARLGSVRRRCIGGEWDGVKPTCFGLSQENDYALEKPPTILFRHQLGPIAQSNDGRLIVYPGTILHLECLWLRKFGTPRWETSQSFRKYPEGWTADPGRDSQLEYRLSIYHAQKDDSGLYTCITPKQHRHAVEIIVKAVHCPKIPDGSGLHISNPSNKMNTRVTFSCKNGNALIGSEQAICLPSGNWSAPPPACENVECPETIPVTDQELRMDIRGREAGGKVIFSCAPGYGLRGPAETICESTGQWSQPLPHCEEVRCHVPEAPVNGYIQGLNAVYKSSDIVQFNCNQGFMMEGQAIIVCQDNGRWSGSMPN